MARNKPWTKEEEEIVIKYYGNVAKEEMMNMLPIRSLKSIYAKANQLREDGHPVSYGGSKSNTFTKIENDLLLAHYGRKPIELILKMLPNRELRSIQIRVGNLRASGYDIPSYLRGPTDLVEKPFVVWIRVGNREMKRNPVGKTLKHAQQRVLNHFKEGEAVIIDGPSERSSRQSRIGQREVLRIEY